MPKPGLRSKAQKRKKIKTPGGENVTHCWRRKPSRAVCSICKRPLQSIPRLRPTEMKKTDKTARRANRMESGRYCSKCLKTLINDVFYEQD